MDQTANPDHRAPLGGGKAGSGHAETEAQDKPYFSKIAQENR
jgi:hypothetical protein